MSQTRQRAILRGIKKGGPSMISDELLNKFDRIEDLPVSEEMLGAYLEGNLHGSEFREINNIIHDDSTLFNLVGIVENDIDFINDKNYSVGTELGSLYEYNDVLADFSLPEIDMLEPQSLIDSSSSMTEDSISGCACHKFVSDDNESNFHHSDATEHGHDQHLNHHELDLGMTNIFDKPWD